MKYLTTQQLPLLEGENLVGYIIRVSAEHQGETATLEEHVDFPPEEQAPFSTWDSNKMTFLMNKITEERNMIYRVSSLVMDKLLAKATS